MSAVVHASTNRSGGGGSAGSNNVNTAKKGVDFSRARVFASYILWPLLLILIIYASELYDLRQLSYLTGSKSLRSSPELRLVTRSGKIDHLVALLNKQKSFFKSWKASQGGSDDDFGRLINILVPWILGDYPAPLNMPSLTGNSSSSSSSAAGATAALVDAKVNCLNDSIFSGIRKHSKQPIVDFIPLGYDLDKLEIRLMEYYDLVDLFVIYESSRTQRGIAKPNFLQLLLRLISAPASSSSSKNATSTSTSTGEAHPRRLERLKNWLPKLMVISMSDNDIGSYLNSTKSATQTKQYKESRKAGKVPRQTADVWALEYSMRSEMMSQFKSVLRTGRSSKGEVFLGDDAKKFLKYLKTANSSSVISLHNDGDEMLLRPAIKELAFCELSSPVQTGLPTHGIYVPTLSFKVNLHWLQSTKDLRCLESSLTESDKKSKVSDLVNYLWRPGPHIWPLSILLSKNDTSLLRHHGEHLKGCPKFHMKLGSGIHMSSIGEPGEVLMKRCGVIDAEFPDDLFPPEVIAAGKKGQLTADMIYELTIKPTRACNKKLKTLTHASDKSAFSKAARDIIAQSLPLAVRSNPDAFPFLVPGMIRDDQAGYAKMSADPNMRDFCIA